jgi:hypothetical protein
MPSQLSLGTQPCGAIFLLTSPFIEHLTEWHRPQAALRNGAKLAKMMIGQFNNRHCQKQRKPGESCSMDNEVPKLTTRV